MDCYLTNCKKYNTAECKECCGEYCQYRDRVDRLFDSALIPKNKRPAQQLLWDSDGTDMEVIQSISNLISKESYLDYLVNNGTNLFFWSTKPGNGKTSCAIQICRAYILKIWYTAEVGSCRVLFVNIPHYLSELKSVIAGRQSDYAEHVRNNILTADIVVFDDIATKTATEFESDTLFTAIDTRLYNGKSNIFTSNTPPEYLPQVVGARIASRIIGESLKYEFKGVDKRGLNGTASSN